MKIEQLDKNLDTIMNNLDNDLFFICLSEVKRGSSGKTYSGKTYKKIASSGLKQMSVEKITSYIEDDRYVLIKVS